jgi:hypothetical protein
MKLWPLLLLVPASLLAQDDMWEDDDWGEDEEQQSIWGGFVEGAFGTRLDSDPLIDESATLSELRWRVETEWQPEKISVGLKADLLYDDIASEWDLDFRDLSVAFSLGDSIDVKLGRQVQTWGTGDLLFLNDLFPKDFVSFFAGRDDEYLKAPGDAARFTWFSKAVNVDFVWTPIFEPDVYLTGERFSFYSPAAGENVAPSPPFRAPEPDRSFSNGEFALRLYRTVESTEYAAYAYRGFSKQPFFERMNAYGASIRRPAGPGLINLETSYYDSSADQTRFLVGYEWEARPRFTVGLQYYLERNEAAKNRYLFTNRLIYRTGMDKYTWSLFTFYSPSDSDFYLRPQFKYRHSDEWSLTVGGNLFGGSDAHTFFNQLQDASNVYLRLRYHY